VPEIRTLGKGEGQIRDKRAGNWAESKKGRGNFSSAPDPDALGVG